MQIFIPIRSAGASPEIGEIYGIVTFFLVGWLVGYSVFFSGTHIARTRVQICTVYGSYDVFSPKDGPYRGCDKIGIHLGMISPKLPKNGHG